MKVAVTYNQGEVFQHFGRTEFFKLYEVEGTEIKSSEVISSNGSGHGALAGVLKEQGVDTLICGGIGGGAQAALDEAGITVYSGAEGDADKAVEAFLKGELVSGGVNCDHHHGEEHSCGEHGCGEHGCGGHGCAGGCGSPAPIMEGKNAGKNCKVHYKGTFDDGTQFDSSYDRGEPLEFVCGVGMMIQGFDKAVVDMEVGEKKTIHLMPEEAYGEADPNAIVTFEEEDMPGSENLVVGDFVYLLNTLGQQVPAKVVAREGNKVTFDANHEMAGKELNFDIELLEVWE